MRIAFFSFLLLLVAASAPAQGLLDRFKPKEPAPQAAPEEPAVPSEVTAGPVEDGSGGGPELKGLVFLGSASQLKPDGAAPATAIEIQGVPILSQGDFPDRMQAFLGQPVSLDLIGVIAAETARYFAEHDHPIVSVVAPEQDVTEGVIQFVVTEARVGEVRVAGNQYFKTSLFRTRLEPGEPVVMSTLENDTAFYGRNPFRSVVAELSPGDESGETDITLRVDDRFPVRAFVGYENSGVETTGEDRLFAGLNYGNLFGLGQDISYQFTTNDDFEQLLVHSATWNIPLPWMHLFQLSGVYSKSNPEMADGFDLTGESWQVGARYIVPLRKIGRLTHEVSLGYDFKFTNNNLQFGGVEIFDTPVEISQFSLGWSGSVPDPLGRTGGSVTGFYSPGGMSSHNDDASFEAARAETDDEYWYVSLGLDRVTRLPFDLTWAASASGQFADGNLQSTEQFIIGGYSTVRGYDELAVSGDHGFLLRNEIYTPPVSVFQLCGVSGLRDQLQFLAFHDLGIAGVADPLPGEDENLQIQSAGLGLRWQIRRNASVRFDYGWQLDDIGLDDDSRAHVGVTVSY